MTSPINPVPKPPKGGTGAVSPQFDFNAPDCTCPYKDGNIARNMCGHVPPCPVFERWSELFVKDVNCPIESLSKKDFEEQTIQRLSGGIYFSQDLTGAVDEVMEQAKKVQEKTTGVNGLNISMREAVEIVLKIKEMSLPRRL